MTWKTEILDQGASLRDRAEAQTLNINEAHLIVHAVMARAFAEGRDDTRNLDCALTDALEHWHNMAMCVVEAP